MLMAIAPSPSLAQPVVDPATVVIEVAGADGIFGFASPTSSLNLSLASAGGAGRSLPITLPAGTYSVVADDHSGLGVVFSAVTCSDGDSSGSVSQRSARIVVDQGEAVTCRFEATTSAERASELIANFMQNNNLTLASLPSSEERVDRLKGSVGIVESPKSFMEALPRVMGGGPVPLSASLAAIDRMTGNQQPPSFDVWLRGTFALLTDQGPQGRFGSTAIGADYRLGEDLLLGGFAQVDTMTKTWPDEASSIAALGWTAGGYATYRVLDRVYLDVLGGRGQSINAIAPYGLPQDRFDASRWLLSASLLGQWELASWTFSPRVQVNYASQTANGYIDSTGRPVSSQSQSAGQVVLGPGVSYRLTTGNRLAVDTGVRFDTSLDLLGEAGLGNLRGRLEGKVDLALPAGGKVGTTLGYGGIGGTSRLFTVRGTLSLPLR